MRDRPTTMRRRVGMGIGAVVATIAIWSLAAPESLGSGQLVALRRFLPPTGLEVRDGGTPASRPSTFLLLLDRRTADEEDLLLSWVSDGGRLVVTDPASQLFTRFGVSSERAGVFGAVTVSPGCVRPETVGVRDLEIAATDGVLSSDAPSMGCFSTDGGSFALFLSRGRGEIVLMGGASFLSDPFLDHADNAVFARSILDAGGPVVLGPPSPPGARPQSLWALVPTRAKAVVWELAVAALLFALARSRRLGRPVPEEPLSPIPSGELVHATARLYRRAQALGFSAHLVRTWTEERLARRFGIPTDPDRRRLAETIADASDQDHGPIERTLAGPDPVNDDEFVTLCRELESMARQIEGAKR